MLIQEVITKLGLTIEYNSDGYVYLVDPQTDCAVSCGFSLNQAWLDFIKQTKCSNQTVVERHNELIIHC